MERGKVSQRPLNIRCCQKHRERHTSLILRRGAPNHSQTQTRAKGKEQSQQRVSIPERTICGMSGHKTQGWERRDENGEGVTRENRRVSTPHGKGSESVLSPLSRPIRGFHAGNNHGSPIWMSHTNSIEK